MQVSLLVLTLVAICNNGINAKPPSKILGGSDGDIKDAPFMVIVEMLLTQRVSIKCSGAIISNRHILTTAHCTDKSIGSFEPTYTNVFFIIPGVNVLQSGSLVYMVEKFYLHPNYITPFNVNSNIKPKFPDIAILKLKNEIPFSPTQRPIELAKSPLSLPTEGFVYGWGRTEHEGPSYDQQLQKIKLEVHNCAGTSSSSSIPPHILCATAVGHSGGACDGDGGSPLIIDGKLAGVFYVHEECTHGYYVNIFPHKSWIENIVNGTTERTGIVNLDINTKPKNISHVELK